METKKIKHFWGTFFNHDAVLLITKVAKLFAWIIISFYTLQWFLQVGIFVTQVGRGFWMGLGFTDIAQNLFWLLEQPLRGLVYFVVLQGVAQVLLMSMDIENNTRLSKKENSNNAFSEGDLDGYSVRMVEYCPLMKM